MEPEPSGIPDRGAGVGSVADETARLLEALLGPAPGSSEPPPHAAPSGEPTSGAPCPTCGHVDTSEAGTHRAAEICHLCPVCQVLRVVRSVHPETLDRLADLAAAVTESLRDAAAERWRTNGAADDAKPAPAPARPQVQDIVVADDDGGADDADVDPDPGSVDRDQHPETLDLEDGR